MIESLLQAVRGAAFVIPSAFGAQEAGLILLCGLFQIPPDQALALSLLGQRLIIWLWHICANEPRPSLDHVVSHTSGKNRAVSPSPRSM